MLQRISKSTLFAAFAMLFFSPILSSFTTPAGGDMFEVYINKKLAIRQYVTMKEPVKALQLQAGNYNDEIEVYYSHCGQTGSSRTVSIRDAQNKTLKEWHFQDSPGVKTPMAFNMKEITGLQKFNSGTTLQLYYTSQELPEGRLLATLSRGSATASR